MSTGSARSRSRSRCSANGRVKSTHVIAGWDKKLLENARALWTLVRFLALSPNGWQVPPLYAMTLTIFARERAMGRFILHETPLDGLKLVERQRSGDERGWFSRFFCREELALFGADGSIAQINQTFTRTPGTVRGLHFQRPPHTEMKLVSCIRGEVFDVAVDLRPESPTFMTWHGAVLSANNGHALMIPAGFAHGFQTLVADCELLYLHDVPYAPDAEAGVNALDSSLAIRWPLAVVLLSSRDRALPTVRGVEFGW